MRAALVSLLLVVMPACSEYEFVTSKEGDRTDSGDPDHDEDTSTPEEDDACDDTLVLDGYPTSNDADCENEVAHGTFTPVVKWYKPTWSVDPGSNQVMSMPIVTQLTDDNGDGLINEDDIPDIVLISYGSSSHSTGGVLRAVSGLDGTEILNVTGQGLQGTGGVAAGDIDGDGFVELISCTPSTVKAFNHDGSLKWTSPSIAGHINGTSDVCSITDMDGDGSVEIICGRAILRADGTIRGAGAHGYAGVSPNNVGSASFAVDVDGDGVQEVVVGNALYRPDGSAIWYNGQTDGYTAVADFTGDGRAEIVVSGYGKLRLQDANGNVLWSVSIPGASSSYYGGPPTVADYDGDGEPEIGVASGSRYSVFRADGSLLWQAVTDDSSSGNTGSAVFDFEGDGVAEVVYADQTRLWVFNGADGSVKLASEEHSNGTWLEYPVVADVDADGHAEIVVVNTAQYGSYSGIHVFGDADDSWRPGRRTWNQHAYHITNVNDDGSIPAVADQNWRTYNSFRSGDMTAGDGVSAPDLVVATGDICQLDCDDGRLLVWVHPGNEGAVDLRVSATLTAYATVDGEEIPVASVTVAPPLVTGEYGSSVMMEIAADDVRGASSLVVRIDSDDLECDESNNLAWWSGPFCS